MNFVPNEIFDLIPFSEAIDDRSTVLPYSADEVRCDADIQRSVALIGENLDVALDVHQAIIDFRQTQKMRYRKRVPPLSMDPRLREDDGAKESCHNNAAVLPGAVSVQSTLPF
jgi:hypothetical protein